MIECRRSGKRERKLQIVGFTLASVMSRSIAIWAQCCLIALSDSPGSEPNCEDEFIFKLARCALSSRLDEVGQVPIVVDDAETMEAEQEPIVENREMAEQEAIVENTEAIVENTEATEATNLETPPFCVQSCYEIFDMLVDLRDIVQSWGIRAAAGDADTEDEEALDYLRAEFDNFTSQATQAISMLETDSRRLDGVCQGDHQATFQEKSGSGLSNADALPLPLLSPILSFDLFEYYVWGQCYPCKI